MKSQIPQASELPPQQQLVSGTSVCLGRTGPASRLRGAGGYLFGARSAPSASYTESLGLQSYLLRRCFGVGVRRVQIPSEEELGGVGSMFNMLVPTCSIKTFTVQHLLS